MKRQAENFHVVVGMTRLIKMPSYWFGDVLAVVFHIQKMFAETISQPSSCFADVKLVTGGLGSLEAVPRWHIALLSYLIGLIHEFVELCLFS